MPESLRKARAHDRTKDHPWWSQTCCHPLVANFWPEPKAPQKTTPSFVPQLQTIGFRGRTVQSVLLPGLGLSISEHGKTSLHPGAFEKPPRSKQWSAASMEQRPQSVLLFQVFDVRFGVVSIILTQSTFKSSWPKKAWNRCLGDL